MLKIPWTEFVNKKEVFKKMETKQRLILRIGKKWLKFLRIGELDNHKKSTEAKGKNEKLLLSVLI